MNHLYRSRKNKIIAGVAGGLAEYLDIDATLLRLLLVLTAFLGGAGILAYIAAAIIIPREKTTGGDSLEDVEGEAGGRACPNKRFESGTTSEEWVKRRKNAGLLLIGLGIIFLAHEILPWNILRYTWPLLLIALGVTILFGGGRGTGS